RAANRPSRSTTRALEPVTISSPQADGMHPALGDDPRDVTVSSLGELGRALRRHVPHNHVVVRLRHARVARVENDVHVIAARTGGAFGWAPALSGDATSIPTPSTPARAVRAKRFML